MIATMEQRAQFKLEPLGPFSLKAAARFWGGFTPAAHAGLDAQGHLHMAFPVEGSWATAGLCVQEGDNASLTVDVYGNTTDLDRVQAQTARILSLDVDGRDFPSIAKRDRIAGELQRRFPGLRPVCFYSAYEAATWAIISHRINMRQAAAIKARIAESFGGTVDIHGQPLRAFPAPSALMDLQSFPGLFGRKVESLQAIAKAALAGDLDAAYLRSLPDEVALEALKALPGIGPFGSELILLRGTGHPDYLTLAEPKFRDALAHLYHFDHLPTDDDLRRISDKWRPYRMWMTFLVRQSSALSD
jgi:DNA-3-methyladenine glycosylase II